MRRRSDLDHVERPLRDRAIGIADNHVWRSGCPTGRDHERKGKQPHPPALWPDPAALITLGMPATSHASRRAGARPPCAGTTRRFNLAIRNWNSASVTESDGPPSSLSRRDAYHDGIERRGSGEPRILRSARRRRRWRGLAGARRPARAAPAPAASSQPDARAHASQSRRLSCGDDQRAGATAERRLPRPPLVPAVDRSQSRKGPSATGSGSSTVNIARDHVSSRLGVPAPSAPRTSHRSTSACFTRSPRCCPVDDDHRLAFRPAMTQWAARARACSNTPSARSSLPSSWRCAAGWRVRASKSSLPSSASRTRAMQTSSCAPRSRDCAGTSEIGLMTEACHQFDALIARRAQLAAHEAAELDAHLAGCDSCRELARAMKPVTRGRICRHQRVRRHPSEMATRRRPREALRATLRSPGPDRHARALSHHRRGRSRRVRSRAACAGSSARPAGGAQGAVRGERRRRADGSSAKR